MLQIRALPWVEHDSLVKVPFPPETENFIVPVGGIIPPLVSLEVAVHLTPLPMETDVGVQERIVDVV